MNSSVRCCQERQFFSQVRSKPGAGREVDRGRVQLLLRRYLEAGLRFRGLECFILRCYGNSFTPPSRLVILPGHRSKNRGLKVKGRNSECLKSPHTSGSACRPA